MGDSRGGTIPTDLLGAVTVPALVVAGGASPAWMADIGGRIADGMPKGRLRILEGREHVVASEMLVPVLAEFFDE